MSTPAGILRVIIKRGNDKRTLDLPAGTASLDDVVAAVAKALEQKPEKPKSKTAAPVPE